MTNADGAIAIDDSPLQSGYPAAENPPKLIDGDPLTGDPPMPQRTKYLNTSGRGSGFIVTPLLGLPVESFQVRLGNDAPNRDAATWELFGFNGALTSPDNSAGTAEAWVPIASGSMGLNATAALDVRSSLLAPIDVPTAAGFTHYKMQFPTLRGATEGLFQMGEIQFYDGNNATGNPILTPGDPILAINSRHGQPVGNSNFPAAEPAVGAIDQNPLTKYLNFGEQRSGLIITNSEGPVDVNWMRIRTANDAVERDPASYELYGTNDPIQSLSNSTGNGGENWMLIKSGMLDLPGVLPNDPAGTVNGDDFRRVHGPLVDIGATTNYRSFKLIFPTVKNGGMANSMQIADVQFITNLSQIPEPSAIMLAMMGLAMAAAAQRRQK